MSKAPLKHCLNISVDPVSKGLSLALKKELEARTEIASNQAGLCVRASEGN